MRAFQKHMLTLSVAALIAGVLTVASMPASATMTAEKCSASDPTDTNDDGLSLSDVKFGVPGEDNKSDANDCFGLFGLSPNKPSDELAKVDSVWGDPKFKFLNKFETGQDGGIEEGDLLDGVKFTLSDAEATDDFEVTWEATTEEATTNLTVDFVFLMKGGSGDNSNAMYLFENIILNNFTSGLGTLDVKVETPNGGQAELSHLSLFGRTTSGDIPPGGGSQIPVPGTLALLGTGLIGLGALARRRRS